MDAGVQFTVDKCYVTVEIYCDWKLLYVLAWDGSYCMDGGGLSEYAIGGFQ